MAKQGFEDFEIKSKVRALLVKYWIDTTTLSIGVHRGYVNIFGDLKEKSSFMTAKVIKRIYDDPFMDSGNEDKENIPSEESQHGKNAKKEMGMVMDNISQKLFNLENEIQNIPGVKSASLDFSNYKRNGGIWKKSK